MRTVIILLAVTSALAAAALDKRIVAFDKWDSGLKIPDWLKNDKNPFDLKDKLGPVIFSKRGSKEDKKADRFKALMKLVKDHVYKSKRALKLWEKPIDVMQKVKDTYIKNKNRWNSAVLSR